VIPQGGGDEDRRGEYLHQVERRADTPTRSAHLVADDAFLGDEQLASVLAIAGRVEVAEGIEEGDEITRLLGFETGPVDAELLHPLGHPGQVIPHRRGEIEERVRTRDAREVGTDL